jgi:hypothetical protein
MKDNDEQSIPSRGSHGKPDAWFAVGQDGRLLWGERRREMVARYVVDGTPIVPLYRSPTLTVEERAAIEYGVLLCDATAGMANDRATIDGASRAADVLRGLLER